MAVFLKVVCDMAESSAYYNPWAEDDSSLGCLRSALQLAERTGHIKGRVDNEEILKGATQKFKSMRSVALLKDIQQRKSQIYKINLEIQKILQDRETVDLTNTQVIERRAEQVSSMSGHIQQLVSCKDLLLSRLQQPYVGEFIKLDANYHQYMSEVLPQVVPLLAELGTQLENMDWVSQTDLNDGQLESLLSDISSALAVLQSNNQSLLSLRQSDALLHSQILSEKS